MSSVRIFLPSLWIDLSETAHPLPLILVPPTVTIDETEVLATVHSAVTLNCQADGYPSPTIVWTRAGRPIENQPGK